MAQKKTTNLLPQKFRTTPNTKFLNGVVEPLIAEPNLKKISGYVGRKLTRSYKSSDGYLTEPNGARQFYQLEPTLVVNDTVSGKIKETVSYLDLMNKLRYLDCTVENESLLFEQQYYNYYGYFDQDKFVNYAQYYWIPEGLPSVLLLGAGVDVVADILGQTAYTSHEGVVFTNGLKIRFDSNVQPSTYAAGEYYVELVGTGIRLVDVKTLITPELYLVTLAPYSVPLYDQGGYEQSIGIPVTPDYFVINRSSLDRNAWSRVNRWFHVDVIHAVGSYNGYPVNLSKLSRAQRPIIEFAPDITLFNYGESGGYVIDILDSTTQDPLSNLTLDSGPENALATTTINGVNVSDGQLVVFTAATDPAVKNRIYRIVIGDFLGNGTKRISLTDTKQKLATGSNLINLGNGKTYVVSSSTLTLAQQKTQVNQPPLFDLFDDTGTSLADTVSYPDSTFIGNTLFTYRQGVGANDTVLGIPLSYRSISNVGDIQFENSLATNEFAYSGQVASTVGYKIKVSGVLSTTWTLINALSYQRQVFEFTADGTVTQFEIDVVPVNFTDAIAVYVNGIVAPQYTYQVANNKQYIVLGTTPTDGDNVTVLVHSDQVSATAFYEIPVNLNNNSDNQDITYFTLGQLRNHIVAESRSYRGTAPLRDAPEIRTYPGTILQHSAPIVPAMFFLTNPNFDFVDSIESARSTYSFFKKRFLEAASTLGGLDFADIPGCVDTIMLYLNESKSPDMPYYYSDMVPYGSQRTKLNYVIKDTSRKVFGLETVFAATSPSAQAVLVYYNGQQLTRGTDYEFAANGLGFTVYRALDFNGVLTVYEYANTDGSYVPETPAKMGLALGHAPQKTTDSSYQTTQNVVIGHDGSVTIAFGDVRDDMLLELELRIYNNIKRQYSSQVDFYTVLPGAFRNTKYTLDQVNAVLAPYYYRWKSENNLNYTTVSFYKNSDPWTWNYYNQLARDNTRLNGSWHAVYQYWYDTDQPNLKPWEMLGYHEQPTWWVAKYGPAPYTSGNGILWADLETGVQTADDGSTKVNSLFARPGLSNYIPVDTQGNLRTPLDLFVKVFNGSITSAVYRFGMLDPVELSWRRSSDYAYAVQIALAVLKPAQYFALMAM